MKGRSREARRCNLSGPFLVLALVLLAAASRRSSAPVSVPRVVRDTIFSPGGEYPRWFCDFRSDGEKTVVDRGPWKVTFGDCVFTGNSDGAPLVRTGSCPDAEGALDLQYRNITEVPALPEGIFAGLASLNFLGLTCNQLTGTLHAGVFHGVPSLFILGLAVNNLTALSPGVFAELSSLCEVDLSRNALSTLPGESFAGLSSLRALNLQKNDLLQCVPLTDKARVTLWAYIGPITCNNLPVVTVCGGVVGLMPLSVSVAYYFKVHGRVTSKTMMMNTGVCSAVAQIAVVIAVVRGAQASEYEVWSFGTVVLVLLIPVDIWSLWSYLKQNKRRLEYLALFKSVCNQRDGHIRQEEFASLESSVFPFNSFPFKWLDDNGVGKISKQDYAKGYELVEAFREFEAGKCRPLCLLFRAKYLDEKEKQKATTTQPSPSPPSPPPSPPPPSPPPPSVRENTNLSRVHPSPAELPGLPQSTDGACLVNNPSHSVTTTSKCDPKTLKVGCSAVAGKGLRKAVGLENGKVLGNFMKDPELAIECEILVAGLGGHEYGCIEDIDNYYSIKYGKSGDWGDQEINTETMKIDTEKDDDENGRAPIPSHVKVSAENGKYHGGIFKKEDYDFGNKGKKLKDFHKHEDSVSVGLLIYEVLILRLYTSTTYRLFNGPMRKFLTDGQMSHHPLRFTIYKLTEGIKKLRTVEAERDPAGFSSSKYLWRGMADMKVDEKFLSQGGTEMAVMSTSSDKEVALLYACSEARTPGLVFKYKTSGLSRGVLIQFLSLYPKEVEFIYPPLTFLLPTGTTYEEGSVTIVEVIPQMS